MATNMPMGFGFPTPPGVPPYPGTPDMNANPMLQNNPMYDGLFAHGLTSNPYNNAQFEDINMMQRMIYGQNMPNLGFPPGAPNPLQNIGMSMPPMGPLSTQDGRLPPGAPGAEGGHGTTGGAEGGHGASNGAQGSTLNQHA